MISYHPALDPSHCSFRLLRVLLLAKEGRIEQERLRIADFYLLFPELGARMTLPQSKVSFRRGLAELHNPYWFGGDQNLVFREMEGIQSVALACLASSGLVEIHELPSTTVQLTRSSTDDMLLQFAQSRNAEDQELSRFISDVILELELRGRGGLKERSGLMDWRYDAV